jgi:hypothetical protein
MPPIRVISPFSIKSFASASVGARLETRSSSIVTGLLSGSAIVLLHLTTRSARYSKDFGIVRPICFAVLRLMMNSNFLGCSRRRSARSSFTLRLTSAGLEPIVRTRTDRCASSRCFCYCCSSAQNASGLSGVTYLMTSRKMWMPAGSMAGLAFLVASTTSVIPWVGL